MKVEKLTPGSKTILQVAQLYAQVFAEAPWNEVSQCIQDGFSGEPVGSACSCGNTRTEAYPMRETIDYIRGEISATQAIALLGVINYEAVAFSWGYVGNLATVATKKWDSPNMQDQVIEKVTTTVGDNGQIFYLSEVGVRGDQRGRGLATQLVQETQRKAKNIPWVIRTLDSSPMACILDKLRYELIIGPGLETQDLERSDRVLYVSPRNY